MRSRQLYELRRIGDFVTMGLYSGNSPKKTYGRQWLLEFMVTIPADLFTSVGRRIEIGEVIGMQGGVGTECFGALQ